MKPSPCVQLPQDLSTTTALAMFNFFNEMADTLWKQYESEFVEGILDDFNLPPSPPIELEFDDDIKF